MNKQNKLDINKIIKKNNIPMSSKLVLLAWKILKKTFDWYFKKLLIVENGKTKKTISKINENKFNDRFCLDIFINYY